MFKRGVRLYIYRNRNSINDKQRTEVQHAAFRFQMPLQCALLYRCSFIICGFTRVFVEVHCSLTMDYARCIYIGYDLIRCSVCYIHTYIEMDAAVVDIFSKNKSVFMGNLCNLETRGKLNILLRFFLYINSVIGSIMYGNDNREEWYF